MRRRAMKPTLITIALLCPWLLAAAAPFPERPLKDLVAESDHIVIATIASVDMVDNQGKPELASTIRLHLAVQQDGVLKTGDENVPDKLVLSLFPIWDSSIGRLAKEQGSKYIFLFNRDIHQSMCPVYPLGFFQEVSKQKDSEKLIQERLRAGKAGESQTDHIREAVFRWQFDHNPLRQEPSGREGARDDVQRDTAQWAPEVYFLRSEKH